MSWHPIWKSQGSTIHWSVGSAMLTVLINDKTLKTQFHVMGETFPMDIMMEY